MSDRADDMPMIYSLHLSESMHERVTLPERMTILVLYINSNGYVESYTISDCNANHQMVLNRDEYTQEVLIYNMPVRPVRKVRQLSPVRISNAISIYATKATKDSPAILYSHAMQNYNSLFKITDARNSLFWTPYETTGEYNDCSCNCNGGDNYNGGDDYNGDAIEEIAKAALILIDGA